MSLPGAAPDALGEIAVEDRHARMVRGLERLRNDDDLLAGKGAVARGATR
jgi:hypothetical protein